MGKKGNLLTESQVRQFMKLANLEPLTPGFINGLNETEELDEIGLRDLLSKGAKAVGSAVGSGVEKIKGMAQDITPDKEPASGGVVTPGGASGAYSRAGGKGIRKDEPYGRTFGEKSSGMEREEEDPDYRSKKREKAALGAGQTARETAAVRAGQDVRTVPQRGAKWEAGQVAGEKEQFEADETLIAKVRSQGVALPAGASLEDKAAAAGTTVDDLRAAQGRLKARKALRERARKRLRQESHGRGRGEGAAGYGRPDDNGRAGQRLREELPPEEEGLDPLDELPPEDPLDELPLEGEEDLEGLEGGGREVSVDDFLAALEVALEDVLGDEVEVEQDEDDEELDLGPEEEPLPPEGELPLGDEELPLQEMINTITKRVAKRIVREALQKKK